MCLTNVIRIGEEEYMYCPVCNELVRVEDICENCGWENTGLTNIDGGPNRMKLVEAQEEYRTTGKIEEHQYFLKAWRNDSELFNVLVIPFLKRDNVRFCIFKRADTKIWQFITGNGDLGDDFEESAMLELVKKARILPNEEELISLDTIGSAKIDHFPKYLKTNKYIIPIHCFAYPTDSINITLSKEHTEYRWVEYDEAMRLLNLDLEKTALWELSQRVKRNDI